MFNVLSYRVYQWYFSENTEDKGRSCLVLHLWNDGIPSELRHSSKLKNSSPPSQRATRAMRPAVYKIMCEYDSRKKWLSKMKIVCHSWRLLIKWLIAFNIAVSTLNQNVTSINIEVDTGVDIWSYFDMTTLPLNPSSWYLHITRLARRAASVRRRSFIWSRASRNRLERETPPRSHWTNTTN